MLYPEGSYPDHVVVLFDGIPAVQVRLAAIDGRGTVIGHVSIPFDDGAAPDLVDVSHRISYHLVQAMRRYINLS